MDALILAGGKSTRMGGRHKGDLTYHSETFLEHLIGEFRKGIKQEPQQIMVSYGNKIHEKRDDVRIVMDEFHECGPIAGIHAGLCHCSSEELMIAACDMPFLEIGFYRYLWQELVQAQMRNGCCYDGIVPVTAGKIHPIAAIYRCEPMRAVLERQIQKGDYRLTDALHALNIRYTDVTEQKDLCGMLQNINTLTEYENLKMREGKTNERNIAGRGK